MNLIKSIRNKQVFIMLSLLLILFLCSCAYKYIPVSQGNIEVTGDYAVLRNDKVMLAVSEVLWTHEPKYLPDSYTTVHIRIQNRTREPLRVESRDFYLIDQNQLQFDIVNSETVLEMMLQDVSLIPDRFSITAETQRENLARLHEIRKNISGKSFVFGEIHPGAFKEGIIFFPKLDSKNQEFIFVYKGTEIKFKKTK